MATSARGIEAARELDGLYRSHAAEVFRYAYAVLGNRADAEDVTQTTFVNALRALERGDRPHTPKNWLITIAHNLIRQRFRQLQARPREVELDHELAAFEPADEGPSIDDLVRALQRIPPTQRQALVLRELEGRSYAEIGALLDVSQSALETLIFRARRSLAEELENLVTCDAAELALSRATDGRLGRKERRRLLAHLNECTSCARIAARGIKRRRAFKALAVLPLPFSLTLFKGAPSASAAAGLPTIGAAAGAGGAAGTAAGIGATGVTAKIAVGLAAVAVAGGAGYEGIKTADGQPPAARAAKVEHIAATPVVGRAEATPTAATVASRGPSRGPEAKATVKPPKQKAAKAKLVKPKVAKAKSARLTATQTVPTPRGKSAVTRGRTTPATTPKTRPDRTSGPQRRAKAKPETTKPAKPVRSQRTPTQKPEPGPVKPPRTANAEKAAKTEKPAKAEKQEPVAGPIGSAKPDKPRPWSQIHRHSFASPIVTGAISAITTTTAQNSIGSSKSPTLKFIPITPAISAPGSRITDVSVSTFMISFVRCPPRAIRTSKEPTIASRASRASCSVDSKRLSSDANRSPESLSPRASSSGCVSATRAERCAASARRSFPTSRRISISRSMSLSPCWSPRIAWMSNSSSRCSIRSNAAE